MRDEAIEFTVLTDDGSEVSIFSTSIEEAMQEAVEQGHRSVQAEVA